jgi:hypothetical protein
MAPLDALGFSADEGIRGGLQKGAEAAAPSAAVTGRVEYAGVPNLTLGASTWIGRGRQFGTPVSTRVWLAEFDARYRLDRLELRTQFADVSIPGAADINDAQRLESGVDPNIARGLRGFYAEAAYRLWSGGPPRDLAVFARYEYVNTQHRMPEGWLPLGEFAREGVTAGVTYYPHADVALKADYVWWRNDSGVVPTPSSFNVGLGWWF